MAASCAAWVAPRSVVSRPTWSVVSPSASLRASRCCGVYSMTCIIGPIISCMAMGSSIMGCIGCAGYSPDIALLLGAGITHTRYGFRALPPSTRLRAEAAYATSAASYRLDASGEFRRPLFPAILYVELRASGLELIRFYGTGNETDGSQPDSVYRVRQTQLLLGPRVAIPLAPRLGLTLGPLVEYTHAARDAGTILALTRPYGTGDFGQVGVRAALELDTRDLPVAPA